MTVKTGDRWHGVDIARPQPIKPSKADWAVFTDTDPAARLPAGARVMIGADFDVGGTNVLGDAE